MTQLSSNRVLVLGRPRDALQDVMEELTASGVSVQGSTDAQYAADLFDARDFDLISFGGAVSGSLNEHLRREFARRSCVLTVVTCRSLPQYFRPHPPRH